MRHLITILFAVLLLASCREDKVIDEPPVNPYGAVITNDTKGQIYVQSRQLVMGMPDLKAGVSTEPVYGSKAEVTIKYFGEGTHFDVIEKQFVLKENQITRLSLTYP